MASIIKTIPIYSVQMIWLAIVTNVMLLISMLIKICLSLYKCQDIHKSKNQIVFSFCSCWSLTINTIVTSPSSKNIGLDMMLLSIAWWALFSISKLFQVGTLICYHFCCWAFAIRFLIYYLCTGVVFYSIFYLEEDNLGQCVWVSHIYSICHQCWLFSFYCDCDCGISLPGLQ